PTPRRLGDISVSFRGARVHRPMMPLRPTGETEMHPGAPAHPLDNPAWSSLTGPHAALAEGRATARRYRSGMSPFAAIASEHDIEAWAELRTLVTPGETVILFG